MSRLGLERLANKWVHTGSFAPGRKICTLIASMVAGATHLDHVDVPHNGATQTVLPFRMMAPSTVGTFLRLLTFGDVRQLDAVAPRLSGCDEVLCGILSDVVLQCLPSTLHLPAG